MINAKPYHSLLAWQAAHRLVLEVYKETKKFPPYELYCIVSQIRRSILSVANNIVEGHAKKKSRLEYFLFRLMKSLEQPN